MLNRKRLFAVSMAAMIMSISICACGSSVPGDENQTQESAAATEENDAATEDSSDAAKEPETPAEEEDTEAADEQEEVTEVAEDNTLELYNELLRKNYEWLCFSMNKAHEQ